MTIIYTPEDYYPTWQNGHFTKKILVEGDSWVSHPQVENLAHQFDNADEHNNLILNLGVPGDNAGSRYGSSDAVFTAGGAQMKLLKKMLRNQQHGEKFDLIFISAAGNDVIGPEIREIPLVNNKKDFPGTYGRDLINLNFYAKLHNVIYGYRRFLNMLASTVNANTPVITHTYAYLKPRKVGTHFFGIKFNKGWIAQHLEHQGIKEQDEQIEITNTIFDRYHQHISALQQDFPQLLVVDTRRTLIKNGAPNTDWFHDEIHPTSAGFKKVYNKIRKDALAAGVWPLS